MAKRDSNRKPISEQLFDRIVLPLDSLDQALGALAAQQETLCCGGRPDQTLPELTGTLKALAHLAQFLSADACEFFEQLETAGSPSLQGRT